MLNIIITLIPVFSIMLVGAFAECRRVLPKDTANCLNQFVYWFSLPSLLFYFMCSSNLADIDIVPAFGCIIGLSLTQIIVTILLLLNKRSFETSVMGGFLSCFPNIAFVGISIVILLYPNNAEAKAMCGLVALVPTVSMVFTDIVLTLQATNGERRVNIWQNLYSALFKNPPFIVTALGIIISYSQVPIPESIMHILRMLGNTAAPCALFCIGMSLADQLRMPLRQLNIDWGLQIIVQFAKLILAPLLVFLCASFLGAKGVSLATMTILSSASSAVTCYIIALKHEALVEDSPSLILFGTVLSVFSLPLVIAMVQKFA